MQTGVFFFLLGEEIKLPSVSLKGSNEGCSRDGHVRLLDLIVPVCRKQVALQMDVRE